MFITILGRQPAIGTAETEAVFGPSAVSPLFDDVLRVKTDSFDIEQLGGTKKAGLVFAEIPKDQAKIRQEIAKYIANLEIDGKITLGLSAYHLPFSGQNLQRIGIQLKQDLKKQGKSLRLVPNDDAALSTATSHHNKLGLSPNKIEILIIGHGPKVILTASTGAQNITAYAARDQKRPKRDAFVGMLPPKLAQIIINLATGTPHKATILDPFCGTGVILQEALLMGYKVYGTDLQEKMIDYSRQNLDWLRSKLRNQDPGITLEPGDATKHHWRSPISAVASEVYLGQPFSAPPSPQKLAEVRRTCRGITADFLSNLAPQIKSGTTLCLAVPAWRQKDGSFVRLDILDLITRLGYNTVEFKHARPKDLLYYRENQVVGRELLVLKRS